MSSLRESIPLQKRKVIKKSISRMIGMLILFGIISVFLIVATYPESSTNSSGSTFYWVHIGLKLWIGFVVLIFIGTPIYQYLYWKRYFYDADAKNITIRKGVFAQKEITLPFSRITDVYVDQDISDVLFKLYDVHISTPTQESGYFAHIDGVNKADSRKLRQIILEGINQE